MYGADRQAESRSIHFGDPYVCAYFPCFAFEHLCTRTQLVSEDINLFIDDGAISFVGPIVHTFHESPNELGVRIAHDNFLQIHIKKGEILTKLRGLAKYHNYTPQQRNNRYCK